MNFNYFYGREADLFSFYRLPQLLINDPYFKELSSDSKILYSFLLNRMNLSSVNNWLDKNNRVYIICTINEIKNVLNCASQKAVKVLKELDDIGLIDKSRQGVNKPNLIYVKSFIIDDIEREKREKRERNHLESVENTLNSENQNSGIVKITNQEFRKSLSNKTYNNNTDYNNTNISINQSVIENKVDEKEIEEEENKIDKIDEKENILNKTFKTEKEKYNFFENEIKTKVEYNKITDSKEKEIVKGMINLITETVVTKDEKIKVGGKLLDSLVVKERFLKLEYRHLIYVIDCIKNNSKPVGNMRSYLITCLYNAIATCDSAELNKNSKYKKHKNNKYIEPQHININNSNKADSLDESIRKLFEE